jgi:hypothetical protein
MTAVRWRLSACLGKGLDTRLEMLLVVVKCLPFGFKCRALSGENDLDDCRMSGGAKYKPVRYTDAVGRVSQFPALEPDLGVSRQCRSSEQVLSLPDFAPYTFR